MDGTAKTPECTRCQTPMEVGFLVDRGDSIYKYQGTWVEGPPQPGFWGNTRIVAGRRQLDVLTYRCPSCGRLESYAHEPASR